MNTKSISITWVTMGILAIVAGILVLIFPDFVRWIIGVFLIVWGILAIVDKR
jgi:uncharacterized membrane protein HdeD (DUF308 family)